MDRLQLIDDNGVSPNDDVLKIEIDDKYAKGEDLQRFEEELKKIGRGSDLEKALRELSKGEYFEMDYNSVRDWKRRLVCKQVWTAQILMNDDKVLYQNVPSKTLAPYPELKRKVPRKKTKEATREASDSGCKIKAVPSDRKNTLSRKSRRRQNQREHKLYLARLMTCGKYIAEAKSKKRSR